MEKIKSNKALLGWAIGATLIAIYLAASPWVLKGNVKLLYVVVAFLAGAASMWIFLRGGKTFDVYAVLAYIRAQEREILNTSGMMHDEVAPNLWVVYLPSSAISYKVDTSKGFDKFRIVGKVHKSIDAIRKETEDNKLTSTSIQAKERIRSQKEQLGIEDEMEDDE